MDDSIKYEFGTQTFSWKRSDISSNIARGANISTAARHNRKIILHAIRSRDKVTCSDLADLTGLTRPAVFKIAKELVEEGLIVKSRIQEKSLGQPSHALRLNDKAAVSLGLNVDRDHLTLVMVDFAGKILQRFYRSAKFAGPLDTQTFVLDCLQKIRKQEGPDSPPLAGIGVAVPDDLGTIVLPEQPESYASWSRVSWPVLLKDVIDAPVYHENDAAAAAMGEMLFGAGLDIASFFYVFIGAGLGGGLVVNKQYLRGAHGRSGELGFLPQVNPLRSSRNNLNKTLGDAVLLPNLLRDLESVGYDRARFESGDGLDGRGRSIVTEWVQTAADYLYLPLLTVFCTLDPDAILVGGALPDWLNRELCYEVSKRLSMHVGIHWPQMAVRPATVQADAAAVGAAFLAFRQMLVIDE